MNSSCSVRLSNRFANWFGVGLREIRNLRRIDRAGSVALIVLSLLYSFSAKSAMAATETWAGVTSNSMSTSTNWTGTDLPPLSGDSLVFGAAGAGGVDLNNNLTNSLFNIGGITFTSAAPSYVIGDGTPGDLNSGNTFNLNNVTGSVTNNSTNTQTIDNPFSMSTTQTFTTTAGGGNIVLGGNISGAAGGITTAGAGIITLYGLNSYTGNTTLGAGTLAVGSGGTFSPNSNVVFNGSSTFNLGGGTQTISNLSFGTTVTSQASSITNGNLIVTGASGVILAPGSTTTGATTLSLSGLNSFTYNQPTQAFTLNAWDGNAADTLTMNLPATGAGQTLITTSTMNIGLTSGGASAFAVVNVNLGSNNTFNNNYFLVGGYRGEGNVAFASGLVNPTLTLRGTAGGFAPVTYFQMGYSASGIGTDTCTFDSSGSNGTIDAIITSAYISEANTIPGVGTMSMGNGTLNAGTFDLGCGIGITSTTTVGTMNQKSGTALFGTLNLGFNSGTGTYTITSGYNLGLSNSAAATLSAASLTIGTGLRNAASVSTLTFNNGTIENYEPSFSQGGGTNAQGGSSTQNLVISGLTGGGAAGSSNTLNIVLVGTNAHNFYAENGYSITVQPTALISGSGALTANGPGTVILNGSNSYTGNTIVNNGTLTLSNNNAIQNSALNTSGTGAVALTVTTPVFGGLVGNTNLASVITSGYGSVTSLTLNPGSGVYDTYAGVISDGQAPMALIKTGLGTQVLSGTNTYTGITTISAGALSITTTAALPGWNIPGSYSVGAGAALAISDALPDSIVPTILATQNFASSAAFGFDTTAGNRVFTGVVSNPGSGALGLTVLGGNSLILTGSNTYTGPTTITSGTLQLGNGVTDGSIASSSGIANNSALLFNVAANQNYPNAISGSGSVSMIGPGLLTLAGTNTYTGPTAIGGGTLQLGTGVRGQDGSLTTSGLVNNGALVYNLSGNQTTNYLISGSGGLVKTGTGTLTLGGSQANTFSGSTVIQGGTLKLGGYALGTPINVAFQNATVNGYTGTGPYGANGTSTWNVFASGVANNIATTTNTLSNLVNATGATVAGTKLVITAGTASVFSTTGLTPAIYNSYGYAKSSVTFSMSGLAPEPYTVYALSSFSGRTGSFAVNGSTNQVTASAASNTFANGGNYTFFPQINPTSGSIAITAAPTTFGTEFDFAGFQFVPDVGTLPTSTALSIAAGSTLDLNGLSQTVASLSNFAGSGGTVTSSAVDAMTLTIAPTGSSTFGGLLQNGSGTLGLAISGTGTEVLSGTNTYSGGTTLQAGILNFASLAALGSGTATFTGNATLQAGVSGALANAVAINSGVTGILDTQGNAVTLSGAIGGAGGFAKVGSGILFLAGSNNYTGTTTIDAGVLGLANAGALAGGGNITFSGGTLQFSSSNTSDVSSKIVSSSSAIALDTNGQSITFNNSLASSNSGGLNIIGNGSLTLAASNAYKGSTTISGGTLQLGSNGAAGSLPTGSAITNNGTLVIYRNNTVTQGTDFSSSGISGTGSLTQAGNGALVLNVSNGFSGATNISAGTLVLNSLSPNSGALPNTSGVAVAGGATFLVKGNTGVGGGLTVNTNGVVNLVDGTTNTLSVGGPINLSGSTIDLELGGSGSVGASDSIVASGAATLSGFNQVNVSAVAGQSITSGSYTLISASGGLGGSNNFILVQRPAGFFQYNLIPSNTTLVLSVSGNPTPANAYWTGLASSNNSAANNWGYGSSLSVQQSNWSTSANGGSDALQVPGAISNVYFTAVNATASSGTLTTQLDGAYGINSLTFDTSAATNQISSVVLNTNGYVLTTGTGGLAVGPADTSNTTISGNGQVQLLASQSWANNSSSRSLTIASAVNGTAAGGNTQSLTFNGTGVGGVTISGAIGDGAGGGKLALVFNEAGTTVLSGLNTYSGGSTIGSGTLQLGSATALGANGPLTFAAGSTGVVQLFGNNVSVGDLTTNASVGTPIIANGSTSAGIATLSVNATNADTYAGVLQDGGTGQLALFKTGTASLTLTGVNAFTGGVTINAGTLQLGNSAAINSTPGAQNAVAFTAGSSGSLNLNGNSVVVASLATNATTPGAPVVQNASSTPIVLTVGNSTNQSGTYAGVIKDGTGGGSVSLVKAGAGTLALNGSDAYSGGTTIAAGTLQLGNTAALGSANAVVTFSANSTGVLALNGNSITLADLNTNAAVGTPVIQSGSSTAGTDVLTVNTVNADSYGGVLQDGGLGRLLGLTKTNSGSLTLSGNNTYSGPTVLNQGTLNIAGSSSSTGALTFGAVASSTYAGTLNVAANATFGSLTVQTSNTNTAPDILNIASGKSLTINGAVVIGAANGASILNTGTTLSGAGGVLNVNGNFSAGVNITSSTSAYPSVDLSGLSAFNLTSTNAGFLRVGYQAGDIATMTLAASNTINVNTIDVGDSVGGNYYYNQSVLNLGTGSNVLQASSITVGISKGGGSIQFASSAGSVTIGGLNGTGVANIDIVNANSATYQASGTNSLLLAGHNATVNAGSVVIGQVAGASAATAPIAAAVTFDTGTFNATSVIIAQDTSGSSTNTVVGSFTLGSNPASTGVLTVTGSTFYLADNTNTVNVAYGTFTINGGTANLSGSIIDASAGTGARSNTTLSLNGGLLNMNNNSIGGTGVAGNQTITNLNFSSGTLENVAQINGGSGYANSTLVKNTTGTLVMAGTNAYSGGTVLNAGLLVAADGNNNSFAYSALGVGPVTLNGGTLAAGGAQAAGSVYGPITAGSGANTIAPGAGLASGYGTLNLNGGLTTSSSTILAFNFSTTSSVGTDGSGNNIYAGDLINLNYSTLDASAGGNFVFGSQRAPTFDGDYRIVANIGYNVNATGLNLPSAPSGESYLLSTSVDPNYLDLVISGTLAGGSSWILPGSGSWTAANNWSPAFVPSSGTVTFPELGAASRIVVNLDGPQSAGALVFSGSEGYRLAAGNSGTLTLNGPSSISVLAGSNGIAAPVELAVGSLIVSASNSAKLTFFNNISDDNGHESLTLNGDGTGMLVLSGTNTYGGGTNVASGTLILNGASSLLAGSSLTIGSGAGPGAVFATPSLALSAPSAAAGLAPVPEPGTLVLLGIAGLAGFGIWRRRKHGLMS